MQRTAFSLTALVVSLGLTHAALAGAPSITSQPPNLGVQQGRTVTFSVAARSAAPATPLTYQWRRNGVAIAGATAASYTTPAVALTDDNALYSVVVASAGVSVTSAGGRLTVVPLFKSASTGHSLSTAVGEDGSVWSWGSPVPSQRANATTFGIGDISRVKASSSTPLKSIASALGSLESITALTTSGALLAWGNGRVGDGLDTTRLYPTAVKYSNGSALTGISSFALGRLFGVAVRKSDGSVWAWGNNTLCVLGIDVNLCPGLITQHALFAQPVFESSNLPLTGVTQVAAAGNFHSLALKSDGTVWSWGYEQYGHLGNGTALNKNSLAKPVLTSTGARLTGVKAVVAGNAHSIAIKADGTVYAWGYNNLGQLGIGTSGTSAQSRTAVQVKASASTFLTGVVAAAAGESHTLFLKSDGSLWGVGANWGHQIGHGSTANQLYPIRVLDASGVAIKGVKSLAAYNDHSLIVRSNGRAYAFGSLVPGSVPEPRFVSSP